VRGFLMPSPELAQRRKGIKTHRPERSSVAGFLSQGSPQQTRQSFCAAKSWQLKIFGAWLMVSTNLRFRTFTVHQSTFTKDFWKNRSSSRILIT